MIIYKSKHAADMSRNEPETIAEIKSIWNSLLAIFLQNKVEFMPKRLEVVIDAKDGNTEY